MPYPSALTSHTQHPQKASPAHLSSLPLPLFLPKSVLYPSSTTLLHPTPSASVTNAPIVTAAGLLPQPMPYLSSPPSCVQRPQLASPTDPSSSSLAPFLPQSMLCPSAPPSRAQHPQKASPTDLAIHEEKYNLWLAKEISRSDRGGKIYVAEIFLEDDICIKVGRTNNLERGIREHRRRCKLDEDEFVEVFNTQVQWANRSESLLHHRLKAVGFTVSDAPCECGTHHIERYASSLETLQNDIDKILGWIDEVRDL